MASFLGLVRVLFLCLIVSAAGAKSCKKPKVRREWRKLAPRERANWIDAVNCLAALPHDPKMVPTGAPNITLIPPVNESSSFWDDLSYIHMDLNPKIHWTGLFFPWHRYYLQFFEDSLIKKCGYKGAIPYWDWTLDSHDMLNSGFFDESSYGVGGWGDPNNDYQINTGGFKDIVVAYPNPHHIRRNFSYLPFTNPDGSSPFSDPEAPPPPLDLQINTTMTKTNVDSIVNSNEGNFIGFHARVEALNGTHGGAHMIVGGDMTGYCSNGAQPPACVGGPKWTPNDPLFFMHHAMVDKIWYDWQSKSPRNQYSYGGGSVAALFNFTTFLSFPTGVPPFLHLDSDIPGDGLWQNISVWDVIDTTGDKLCYTYA